MLNKVKSMFINSDKTIASNMILSGICKPISMIISYIYVPIVLNYLGIEKYGVWSTILTILSWISYFDIGIGNGLRNRLTESLSKKDGQSKKLVSSAYGFITIIMTTVAIIFAIIASFVNWNKIFGVKDIKEDFTSIIIISACFVAINFILSICKNVLYALQKAANVSIMELMVQILNMGGILVAMQLFDSNLFIMSLIYGMSMIIVNLVASVIIFTKNQEIKPEINYIDISVGKSLTNLGLQFFIIQICALVLFTTDSLIISYLYGAVDVTPYNTVNKLFNVIISVYSALITPVWSAITKAKTENRYNTLEHIILNLYLMVGFFSVFAIILLLIFKPVAKIWLRQELIYSTPLIICGCMYCILNMWTNVNGTIANGLGILKQQIVMAVSQSVLNIPLSILFAKCMGLNSAGVLLGTNCTLLISCITLPILIHKKIKENNSKNENCDSR